ncbi:MAG: hypothetical protein OCD00_12830 [Colwellia sp.]
MTLIKTRKTSRQQFFISLVLSLLLALLVNSMVINNFAHANNSLFTDNTKQQAQWQPISSDKLIRLPANVIEKRIQQDFQASPMAIRLVELEQQMQSRITDVKAIQQQLTQQNGQNDFSSNDENKAEQQFQLLQNKSAYLDLLQESHALRQTAMNKKQVLFQKVLNKLQVKNNKVTSSDSYQLKQAQSKARQRMEKVMAEVDLTLMHSTFNKPSPYSSAYATNVAKIEQLKKAIGKHKSNASVSLNGVPVSSTEYVRQLLMEVSSEQSLLDQEKLMLSYMAKLVALDAQSLEYQVAYGDEDQSLITNKISKAANVTDLFIQE